MTWRKSVTPLAGVWIEMTIPVSDTRTTAVTPLAGVWIEISKAPHYLAGSRRHSPCGSVD